MINNGKKLKILGLVIGLLAMASCKNCRDPLKPDPVTSCSAFNQSPETCNSKETSEGQKCQYDTASSMCLSEREISANACNKLGADACRASSHCTYSEDSQKCANVDPALKGNCRVIQTSEACDAASCSWNHATNICENKI